MIAPIDLHAIRKRADAATKGPWAWDNRGEKSDDIQVGVATLEDGAELLGYFAREDVIYVDGVAREITYAADADFIAHARTDVAGLNSGPMSAPFTDRSRTAGRWWRGEVR